PSCATGYIGSGGTPPFAEAIMLADTSGTVAAGFVGCLNGAWDIQHRTFADKLEENLGESSPGAALTKVVFDTVRDLHDAGYGHYARGITMYGGHLLVREDNAPTSVETPSPTTAFDIIVRPNPTRGQIIIETRGSVLPGGLRFAVFDASGRRVREITQDPANEL